jgi:hypothetical protein
MGGVSESDLDWLASIGADFDVIEAHLEGVRKLREWEDNDFDLARYESHMRLFDDEMEDVVRHGRRRARGGAMPRAGPRSDHAMNKARCRSTTLCMR